MSEAGPEITDVAKRAGYVSLAEFRLRTSSPRVSPLSAPRVINHNKLVCNSVLLKHCSQLLLYSISVPAELVSLYHPTYLNNSKFLYCYMYVFIIIHNQHLST